MDTLRYNEVRQKGSHNAYQRLEGYPDQALYWRVRSLEIDIHNGNDAARWPALDGDWYVYHLAVVDQASSANRLSDALDLLRAFHLAVPDHEVVTVWLDIKDSFSAAGEHTPEALDRLLVARLGAEAIWGPPDLVGTAASLQQAIAAGGWPSLASLRGKFIFACTTGDLSRPDSHLNQYVDNGATASRRMAFVAPEIADAAQIGRFDYAVFFNLDAGHAALGAEIGKRGFVSRAYGLDSKNAWCTAWQARVHHLTTNKVNAFGDEWARTDQPATGYPSDPIGEATGGDAVEAGALYAIDVASGDIWGNADSCFFQYDDHGTAPGGTHSAFVGNPRSHVDGWIKAGLMARSSVSADAAYVAVLRTGANGIRLQWRGATGGGSRATGAVMPAGTNGHPLVDPNAPIWIRLEIANDGKSATGYYAIDGTTWRPIGSAAVDQPLALQGWAASAHGAGAVKCLFGGAAAPLTGAAIGAAASGHFATGAAAASLGPKPASASCDR